MVYSEKTAVPYNELDKLQNIQYQEGLPENFGNAQGKPRLLILDDLLNEVYSEAYVACLLKLVITGKFLFFS